MSLTLMYITNDPKVALIAEKYGVDRVWIDLETLGKEERQKNMNTVKSKHKISDIVKIAPLLTKAEMLVRVNPINPDSEREINEVIAAGADMIMLPMWKTAEDVSKFLGFVNKRVKTTLLLETKEAAECVDEILALGGFDEIHIGLNDLHLAYGMDFMFELLADGTVEKLCKKFANKGLPYGFGGIAKIGEGTLPADAIVREHYRLGSTRAILSRSFCNTDLVTDINEIETIFSTNMRNLREFEKTLDCTTEEQYKTNTEFVAECVAKIVEAKRSNNQCI